MGKKAVDKGREWEKERRDKLNVGFHELCKLLPDHDPSINMSKMEILRKATEFIKHLQEKNEEIIKCGNEKFLKSETERLKKRVAYLLLKTSELVDALRQAGVPIPSKSKKKNAKGKNKEGTQSLNQQNSDPAIRNKSVGECNAGKLPRKKKVKCGCEKKLKLNKKPLTEVNPSASVVVSGVSSSDTVCLSDPVKSVCNDDVSQNGSKKKEHVHSLLDKSVSQSINQNTNTQSIATQSITRNVVTQSVVHPLIQNAVGLIKPTQTLNVDKKELSKLGPGTLIFADGRVVNVPPVLPQIVVKPPPPAPPPAVILMQTPELALQKKIVKISGHDDKKEKFIIPKKREITMTTFVNKVPIPAVKAFRLEPCAREPRVKKKTSKDQRKNPPVEATSSTTGTTTTTIVTSSAVVETSTDSVQLKRKNQEESKTLNKIPKNSGKETTSNSKIVENTSLGNNSSETDERSHAVKYSIDGLFNKQVENEVFNKQVENESFNKQVENEVESADKSTKNSASVPIDDVSELNAEVTFSDVTTSSVQSSTTTTQVVIPVVKLLHRQLEQIYQQ